MTTSFVWGGPPPTPTPGQFSPRADNWWRQYESNIGSMRPRARSELARTSRAVNALMPDPAAWGTAALRKGIVIGAVQSGKTASMMGVAAVALDQGYRVVVVLAGLKDDLRQQTARRFNVKLLGQSDLIPWAKPATTTGTPVGPGPLGGYSPSFELDAHDVTGLHTQVSRSLTRGKPAVIVVKKNSASLTALRDALSFVYDKFGRASVPTLILDDECDEASVGSAAGEELPLPAGIANLWRIDGEPPRVAYVGYTATAAANIFQDSENPLFPTDFAYMLRVPGEKESITAYAEDDPTWWHTGGQTFFEDFGDEPLEESNFLVAGAIDPDDVDAWTGNLSLEEALIAYLVGGAYRLALSPGREFGKPDAFPDPHSMLVHTSPNTADHLAGAAHMCAWGNGTESQPGVWTLSGPSIAAQAASDEPRWRSWYDRFTASRERVVLARPRGGGNLVATWSQVRTLLPVVAANTRIKVVNSDKKGSTLDFNPILKDGQVHQPLDCYTIAVGGGKLSRGLTIEGLCISYFSRWANSPQEDTIIQMSRWYGYRGPHLEFCRLFATQNTLESLIEIHENDFELRLKVADAMARGETLAGLVLAIRATTGGKPTGKLPAGTLVNVRFSPFAKVFPDVECGPFQATNETKAAQVVASIRARSPVLARTASNSPRGEYSAGWTADEVAALLDALDYTGHNPDPSAQPMPETYRPPRAGESAGERMEFHDDPYAAAAYLRLWARGGRAGKWPAPPTFNVGFVFGELATDTLPFGFALMNRTIGPDDRMLGGWTGRSGGWAGDAMLDGVNPALRYPNSAKRRLGAPGLLLLHIMHKNGRGRRNAGKQRAHNTPTWGLIIPEGGPALRYAVKK